MSKKRKVNDISKIFGWTDKSGTQFLEGLERFKIFLKENSQITYKVGSKKSNLDIKKVVFSGFRDKNLLLMAEQKGYEIFNSISSKINILVVKDLNSKSGKKKRLKS